MTNIDAKNEQGAGADESSGLFRNFRPQTFLRHQIMKFANRRCVLHAEDDEDTGFMVATICKFAEIEVVNAETIAETWQLAQINNFDLYLLDSRFPDGSGLELCRLLREYAPHTPILFYSGDAAEIDVQKGLTAGANEYLIKPYFGDIALKIKQSIERAEKSARQINMNFAEAKSASLNS